MEYTVDYFIQKFKAIPAWRWTTDEFTNGYGKCCALGHCGVDVFRPGSLNAAEPSALQALLRRGVTIINDGEHPYYAQPTPKQRILAALRDVRDGNFII